MTHMKGPVLMVLSLALLMPAKLAAANNCPWLTKGSAETALGGSVTATVEVSNSGEGFCTFTRQEGTSKDTLKIVVQKTPQPSCPAGSPKLTGIGNEAVMCTVRRSPEQTLEMIVSRVRELNFTISMTSHKQPPKSPETNPGESTIAQVAEQVAGNLF